MFRSEIFWKLVKAKGHKKVSFARFANTSRVYVYLVTKHKTKLTFQRAKDWAAALGMDHIDFCKMIDPERWGMLQRTPTSKNDLNAEEVYLINLYRQLPKTTQSSCLALIQEFTTLTMEMEKRIKNLERETGSISVDNVESSPVRISE